MKKSSIKFLSPIFLVLTVFLSNLLIYDYDTCSPIYPVHPQNITRIELVLQLEKHDIPQIHNYSSSDNLGEESASFFSKHPFNNKISHFHFIDGPEIKDIINRHLDIPANHIISILQKKNHWHQSSDDEPSSYIYS